MGEQRNNQHTVKELPLEFLKSQKAIPIRDREGQVVIALADPLNIEAYDAIMNLLTALPTQALESLSISRSCARKIYPASEIDNAISHCYYTTDEATDNTAETILQGRDLATGPTRHAEDLLNVDNKAPAIKLVNQILFQAVHSRASDIHVEPYETEARIRFRVDGVLHDILSIPQTQIAALQSRLKIMANLNIAERRLPQDGQSRIKIGDDLVDVRVSVIPTLGGERIVLRLLDKGRGQLTLAEIGFSTHMQHTFERLIHLPHGIILLTGPTGSGKTTTLYGALNALNCQESNILTVEDPVEYQLPGIGQMQVKPKIGLTFANCLRHILRQDPDVIMIGEIRDVETARIAIQASMTGHLVFSTLHTNDAASAITRLTDMGIEPFLIASSMVAVIAQRLVRIICPHCKEPDLHTPVDSFPDIPVSRVHSGTLYKGRGCEKCMHTGFLERTAIFELLLIDDDIREHIIHRSSSHTIHDLALSQGMTALVEDGLAKAIQGITTPSEVYRVTQDSMTHPVEVS
jgi:general secretion pathway protein E